jgi:multiple sugar transport system permease protein
MIDAALPRTRRRALRVVRIAAGMAAGLGMILPLIWMVSVSLRRPGQALPRRLEWIPDPVTWSNYREVFDVVPFARFAANSAFVVVLAVPITIVVSSWAGFALSQLSPAWRLRLSAFSFGVMMIPVTAFWLTRFIMFERLGLIDSRLALVVPALAGTSPLFMLLFLWTFTRIPQEIFEAARLDGANAIRAWAGVAMPLARPTVVAVAVLAFVHFWRDFIEPLLYIQSTSKMTLPLGLKALQQLDETNWPILLAGSVLVTAPIVVVFLLVQRAFLQPNRGAGFLGR